MTTPHADTPPVDVPDEPQPQPPGGPEPPEWCCRNAHAHHVQQCPSIRALLFAPTRYLCDSCGDPTDADSLCRACVETGERDRWGIALELRARIRTDAQRREVVGGVLSVF